MVEEQVTALDVLLEGVRLLLSETRRGTKSGRVEVTDITGLVHESLETFEQEGRLQEWTSSLLNTCMYPTSREDISAYERLRVLFENGLSVKYARGTLVLRYHKNGNGQLL